MLNDKRKKEEMSEFPAMLCCGKVNDRQENGGENLNENPIKIWKLVLETESWKSMEDAGDS